jgi:hypothetical protein
MHELLLVPRLCLILLIKNLSYMKKDVFLLFVHLFGKQIAFLRGAAGVLLRRQSADLLFLLQ